MQAQGLEVSTLPSTRIRDTSLYVEVIGRGYPLLIMHGGPGADHCSMLPFREIADEFTLVFYDHRCNGRSVGAPVASMTWENLTADADALREHLGFEHWAVLGHSFGGHVALEYALRYPERVSHLVLLDSGGEARWAQQHAPQVLASRGYSPATVRLARRFFNGRIEPNEMMRGLMRFGGAYFHRPSPSLLVRELIAGRATKTRPEALIFAGRELLPGWSVMDRLAEIQAATLVIAGRDDFIFPPEHQLELAAGITGSRLEIVERAGHNAHSERAPEVMAAVRDFISEPPARPADELARPPAERRIAGPPGSAGHRVVRVSDGQRQIDDWLAAAARRHTMHALLELDVTDARRAIRERRATTGDPLSFTAFIVACLARAIDEDRTLHAHRKGRRELVLFDDVDVTVVVERTVEAAKIPLPHIVRAANRKTPADITREIRDARSGALPYAFARRLLPAWLLVPGVIRRFAWSRVLADPWRRKRLTGTTFVSAVGMFGQGSVWGIPQALNYTLGLTVGGIARKAGVVRADHEERIEPREFLSLTLSIDHEVVEGAPAARFTNRLKELVEGAGILADPTPTVPLGSGM